MLVPLYAALYKRVDNNWNASLQSDRPSNASNDILKQDVIQDKILAELTREVLQIPINVTQVIFFSIIFTILKCLNRSKDQQPKPTPLCAYIMQNENIIGMWLLIAIRTLSIPDTTAGKLEL